MAKEFTEKSRYKSSYSESYITAAQYIVELVCENIALKKSTQLPYKFWNNNDWKSIFKRQLLLANGLLKIYDEQSIIKALRTYQGKKIQSLAAAWILDKIIDDFQKQKDSQQVVATPEVTEKTEIRKRVVTEKTIWSIDDED